MHADMNVFMLSVYILLNSWQNSSWDLITHIYNTYITTIALSLICNPHVCHNKYTVGRLKIIEYINACWHHVIRDHT